MRAFDEESLMLSHLLIYAGLVCLGVIVLTILVGVAVEIDTWRYDRRLDRVNQVYRFNKYWGSRSQ